MRHTHPAWPMLFAAMLVAAACSPNATGGKTAEPTTIPFEVVVAVTGEPSTMDPHQQFTPNDLIYQWAMFDKLIQNENPGEGPAAGLAESWKFSSDGMSLTLNLRHGVKFQDGTPFNADAVKFSYERQLDPNNEYYKLGTFKLAPTEIANIKLPVEVVDDYTVKLNFKALQAPDLNLEQMIATAHSIVSPTAVKTKREKFPDNPVGTGPFRLVSWEKGQRIVLERNPDYWGPKSEVDRLIFLPVKDADARLAALQAGSADLDADVSGDQFDAARSNAKFDIASKPTRGFWHVLLNEKQVPQLRDVRVRQALNYAVDRQAIVHDINRDTAVIATSVLSPALNEWSNKDLKGFAYDPAKAKQLLSAAGFPDGKGFPALAMKVPTDVNNSGKPVATAEAIQANLAAIGIKVTIEPMAKATWDQQVTTPNANFELAAFPLGGSRVDPDNYLAGYHSTRVPPSFHNYGYYLNAEYEKLWPQSRVTLDKAERQKLIWRMQEIAGSEDPATIAIMHMKFNVAYNKAKLKNVVILNSWVRYNLLQRP